MNSILVDKYMNQTKDNDNFISHNDYNDHDDVDYHDHEDYSDHM